MILSNKQGISSSEVTNMPMYSKSGSVTTGKGNISGKAYIKLIDEHGPSGEGREETKVLLEEVHNDEDGDIVFVGYVGYNRNLAIEALAAAYKYIDKNLMPEGQSISRNLSGEWERETIRRFMTLIQEEVETNNKIPRYIREKHLYQ